MEFAKAILFKVGQIILSTLGVFRRALCCLRRRRRVSDYGLPFTTNDIAKLNPAGFVSPTQNGVELQSWDSWNESELAGDGEAQKGVNGVRVGLDRVSLSEEGPDDFFREMTPAFTRPKKFLIKNSATDDICNETNSSRLSMDLKAPISNSAELGTIDDHIESWEDAATSEELWDGEIVLKEQRMAERQRRLAEHQKKKFEKDAQRLGRLENTIGTRLS